MMQAGVEMTGWTSRLTDRLADEHRQTQTVGENEEAARQTGRHSCRQTDSQAGIQVRHGRT